MSFSRKWRARLHMWSRRLVPGLYYALSTKRLYDKRKTVPLDERNQMYFARACSESEAGDLLKLFDRFLEVTPAAYAMAYGSLLGALLYRGMIPWDDDIDIYCDHQDYDRIRAAVEATPDLAWHDIPLHELFFLSKITFHGAPIRPERGKNWPWPFIDILWLKPVKSDTLLDLSNGKLYRREDVFPFLPGAGFFEGHRVNLPARPVAQILDYYPMAFDYAIPSWTNHREEEYYYDQEKIKIPLEQLAALYPVLGETLPGLRAEQKQIQG